MTTIPHSSHDRKRSAIKRLYEELGAFLVICCAPGTKIGRPRKDGSYKIDELGKSPDTTIHKPFYVEGVKKLFYEGPRPPLNLILKHFDEGRHIGIVPLTVGCVVVDVDGLKDTDEPDKNKRRRHNIGLADKVTALLGDGGYVGKWGSVRYDLNGGQHVYALRDAKTWPGAIKVFVDHDPLNACDYRGENGYVVFDGYAEHLDASLAAGVSGQPNWHLVDAFKHKTPPKKKQEQTPKQPKKKQPPKHLESATDLDTLLRYVEKSHTVTREGPDRIVMTCPHPDHAVDATPSMFFYAGKNGAGFFKCHGCGVTGTLLQWVEQIDRKTPDEADAVFEQITGRKPKRRKRTGPGSRSATRPSRAHRKSHPKPVKPKTFAGWLEACTELGIEWRFNTRSLKKEVRIKSVAAWSDFQTITDEVRERIRVKTLPESFGYEVYTGGEPVVVPYELGKQRTIDYIAAECAVARADPFRDYLLGLPDHDGVVRRETMVHRLLGCENNPYTRFCSRQVPVAAAHYALVGERERVKLDETVILQDAVGRIGKSSMWQMMIAMVNPEWFSDSLRLSDSSKQFGEKTQSKVIVEFAELGGLTRADLNILKTILTSVDDGGDRKAWRVDPLMQLRRWVGYGTANRHHCLTRDEALNQRFLVVPCGLDPDWKFKRENKQMTLRHIEAYIQSNLDQLWAEALSIARRDKVPWFPTHDDELVALRDEVHAKHAFAGTAFDELVQSEPDRLDGLPFQAICEQFGLALKDGRACSELRSALESAGFIRDEHPRSLPPDEHGQIRRVRLWYRPGWKMPEGWTAKRSDEDADALSPDVKPDEIQH